MYHGKNRDEWSRLSVTLALTANINRDTKQRPRPFEPSDFDIYGKDGRLKKARREINPPLSKVLESAFGKQKEG